MAEQKKSGCGKALMGCGAMFALLAIVGGIVIAVKWDEIGETLGELAEAGGDMMAITQTLYREYPAEGYTVNYKWENGVRSLAIGVENPTFAFEEGADLEARAREMAVATRALLDAETSFEVIIIDITLSKGSFVKISKNHTFSFAIEDLPAPVG